MFKHVISVNASKFLVINFIKSWILCLWLKCHEKIFLWISLSICRQASAKTLYTTQFSWLLIMSDQRDDSALTKQLLAAWYPNRFFFSNFFQLEHQVKHYRLEQYILYFHPKTLMNILVQQLWARFALKAALYIAFTRHLHNTKHLKLAETSVSFLRSIYSATQAVEVSIYTNNQFNLLSILHSKCQQIKKSLSSRIAKTETSGSPSSKTKSLNIRYEIK